MNGIERESKRERTVNSLTTVFQPGMTTGGKGNEKKEKRKNMDGVIQG